MNKQERVLAAIQGKALDYVPYSLWYHFGTQFRSGEQAADIQIAFYERFDLDFLKVMNDFSYPLPDGIDRIRGIWDWDRMKPVPITHPCFSEQLKLLRRVAEKLDGEAFFLDTVFNPLGVARRTAKDVIFTLMREYPQRFKKGLEAITESLYNYVKAALEAGASGIFFSVNGANKDLLTKEEVREFVRPFDFHVLEAAKGRAAFNAAHIHGFELLFDEVVDYPVDVFNWSHLHSEPSLSEASKMTTACLMGGIDERLTNMFHPDELENQVAAALSETGGRRFILGPGCAIPTDMPPEQIDIIRNAVRKGKPVS